MASIGVYGATGYTGRLVARWLATRGHRPVLAGRHEGRLERVAGGLSVECDVIAVDIDDADGLLAFARRCDGLIHCAGPFSRYGEQLVRAAVEAGTPYVDHASQPEFVYQLMADYGERASATGVAIVPAMSFYTGLADLIVQSCAQANPGLQGVAVAYHVDGWRPTLGSLITGGDVARQQRVAFSDNEIRLLPPPQKRTVESFVFPEPIGKQPVIVGYAGCCEPITVPKHTAIREVQTFASTATFSDSAFSPGGLPYVEASGAERGSDAFMVVVEMRHSEGRRRRAWARGAADIYDVGALISVLGIERLAVGAVVTAGVLAPGEAFGDSGLLEEFCQTDYVDGGLHSGDLVSSSRPAI